MTVKRPDLHIWARILVQVTIYRRLLIGRDGHLDQSEAYAISQLVREYGPCRIPRYGRDFIISYGATYH